MIMGYGFALISIFFSQTDCLKKWNCYICAPKNASLAQLVEQLTCNQ